MSKFEINRITRKLIRAILRFCFSFPPPTMYRNNIWKLFSYIVGGGKEKPNLRMGMAGLIFEPRPPNFRINTTFEDV